MNLSRTAKLVVAGVIALIVLGLLVWLLLPGTPAATPVSTGSFGGTPGTRPFGGNSDTTSPSGGGQITQGGHPAKQNIFKISDGPVTGAMFVQTKNPTTTLARFVMQTDGHTYDLPIDVPGAIVRLVSNTTIPGTARILWVSGGTAMLGQYVDGDTVKTVYVAFPKPGSATNQAQRIQFLPDNIIDLAVSPDGNQVAYLLPSTTIGSDGYTAHADGTGAVKLFSMTLRQLVLSWPNATTLLLVTKSHEGAAGAAFAVGTKSGTVVPIVYGKGLTAVANSDYTKLVYQLRDDTATSYVHDFVNGNDYALPTNPDPERCIEGQRTSLLYCAAETDPVRGSFLDYWHQGALSQRTAVVAYDTHTTVAKGVATPGLNGGKATDIAEMALSPDGKYLLYVSRGDRSLWGVRLTQ